MDTPNTNSEYQIKLATIQEYHETLRLKKVYDDLIQELLGLLPEIVDVLNRAGTIPKDRIRLNRAIEAAYCIVQRRMKLSFEPSPETDRQDSSPGELTEYIKALSPSSLLHRKEANSNCI